MFDEPQKLIVVYKDELVLNQLRKLIETNDDREDGEIVGTEDGTVAVIAWDEKMWLEQKKAGNVLERNWLRCTAQLQFVLQAAAAMDFQRIILSAHHPRSTPHALAGLSFSAAGGWKCR